MVDRSRKAERTPGSVQVESIEESLLTAQSYQIELWVSVVVRWKATCKIVSCGETIAVAVAVQSVEISRVV